MSSFLEKAKYSGSYATSISRSAGFLAQNLSLAAIEAVFQKESRFRDPEFKSRLGMILQGLNSLLQKDARDFSKGIFPPQVFIEENPVKHTFTMFAVLADAFLVAQRRKKQDHSDLPSMSEEELAYYPEYYRRNFHYQTDGYFSEYSGKIYDHQVEVLFSGAGGPMRRAVLAPLKGRLKTEDGQGLRILEVGAGTGSFTRHLKLALPKAHITALDFSQPYLKLAQKRLGEFDGLEFTQGDAAHLPYKDGLFDAVVSCFLFHELPLNVRRQVIAEAQRVLKPGGLFTMTDALQKDEDDTLNWAINKFPLDFHEPFFKNYTQHKMESLLSQQGFTQVQTEPAFLSKVVLAKKA